MGVSLKNLSSFLEKTKTKMDKENMKKVQLRNGRRKQNKNNTQQLPKTYGSKVFCF